MSSPLRRRPLMANELETQGAGYRRRLDELDTHRIAEAVGDRMTDEGASGLIEAKILVADGARRNKAIRAGFVEFDEQAGAGDAGNVPVERGADAIGQEVCDQPVRRLALGLHGAAFGSGNVGGDFGERSCVNDFRQAVAAEFSGADQGAMHDEIGIAADR
jgi:hypothetical protein